VLYLPWRAVPAAVPRGRGWVDDRSFAYVLPRRECLVLGGTYEEGDANEAPDAAGFGDLGLVEFDLDDAASAGFEEFIARPAGKTGTRPGDLADLQRLGALIHEVDRADVFARGTTPRSISR
jgi:hypothetical protein